MSANRKIQATKNYRLFSRSQENRPLDLRKHRKLEQSLKQYGFLPSFPIVCVRDADKHLVVKDGQHRLALAETLGLAVYWTEEEIDFDVAVINCTSKTWALRDYAQKFATNGLAAYREGLDFMEQHGLPIGMSFALLAGYTSFTHCERAFVSGAYKVKDRTWANAVAGVYGPMCLLSPSLTSAPFAAACMGICRVKDFDAKRLLHNAERCREKLVSYSTREAYLDMLEQVYNFGRAKLVGLKAEATMAMRDRNAVNVKKAAKAGKAVLEAIS